jgi:asparagine synthase (glutamine-hydrolysing)
MCGITGIADPAGVRADDTELVDAMLRTLAHRGPDDHLVRAEAGAVLGTRRLSIIDVAGGRQPLANEDGTVVATQNGEIYNYVELRRTLLARGHSLRSEGDTETIVHLYEDHGEGFVEHLRGMFAIALWDGARGRLLLARDRIGKKPLYWRLERGRLSYGSELKALLADPSLDRSIDRDALGLYLGYQYIPSPKSILAGVHKLPPASVLVWDGGQPRIERYWEPSFEPKVRRTVEEDRDECLDRLREAVRIRLRSDVPVGSFLSGGMDSSVVTGLMAQLSSEPVRTFTIGFDVARYDERPYADAVARHFSTRHTSEVVSLDALDLLPQLANAFDEPFGDASAVPTLRVAQLAAKELKVVMTGDGGDELFGGYTRYARDLQLHRVGGAAGAVLAGASRMSARMLGIVAPTSRVRRQMDWVAGLAGRGAHDRYDRLMRMMPPETERLLIRGAGRPSLGFLDQPLPGGEPRARLDQMLRTDLLTYLPEDLLVKVDRATMAVSLEARSPLLDQELIAFAGRLPIDRKLYGGRSKVVLREVARTVLPPHLVDRPKRGFAVPIDAWFTGPFGDRFAELALAPDAFLRDVIDIDVVQQLYRDHSARRRNHGRELWQLLSLELWGRTWARSPKVPIQAVGSPALVA